MSELRYVAKPYTNDPPYLFHIANHCTDVPSALSFLREVEDAREEYDRDRWADARAMGIV
jgi:hypothetical protein